MTRHRDLTGPAAVHPFAFIQDTDPFLDEDNGVTAGKAWIDTSLGNTLKIRNDTNDDWNEVLGTNPDIILSLVVLIAVYDIDTLQSFDVSDLGFTELVYVP